MEIDMGNDLIEKEPETDYPNGMEPEPFEEEPKEESTNDEEDSKFNPLEGFTGEKITNPVKAIRAKCLECSSRMVSEIKHCVITDCDLFPFRMGRNPYRSVDLSEEARAARVERGRKLGESRKKKEVDSPKLRL